MNTLRTIAYALVITGAIVWGLVGLFDFNLIASMLGDGSILSRIIYTLVGAAGIVMLATSEQEECFCECNENDMHY